MNTLRMIILRNAGRVAIGGAVLASVAGMASPIAAIAATYAYVDQLGVVRTVEADNAADALLTAPVIATHSGVMLISSSTEDAVGTTVQGVQ